MTERRFNECIVCRAKRNRKIVEVTDDARIPLVGGIYAVACPEHRDSLELGLEVALSATRAGVGTVLERSSRAREAAQKVQQMWSALGELVRVAR